MRIYWHKWSSQTQELWSNWVIKQVQNLLSRTLLWNNISQTFDYKKNISQSPSLLSYVSYLLTWPSSSRTHMPCVLRALAPHRPCARMVACFTYLTCSHASSDLWLNCFMCPISFKKPVWSCCSSNNWKSVQVTLLLILDNIVNIW